MASGTVNRTEVIKKFLHAHAVPELASLYTADMEVQVNVAAGEGDLVKALYEKGDRKIPYQYWTDGKERWKHFRIPWNAHKAPEYVDKPLRWSFDKHVEAIGLTGWDWKERCSRWVGFDFDSIATHTSGLTDVQLLEVQRKIEDIPWVTIRKSKSGSGIHVYVFLDPVVETATHTEHASLARALLAHLSALVGVNLREKVDKFGGILWIWHRSTLPTGFDLIKEGESLTKVPPNWREHQEVITGKRYKVKKPGAEDTFFSLTRSYRHVSLDDEHRKLIGWFERADATWWWDSDHHMLVCHTFNLKQAHADLKLKGIFETISTGKDCPNDQNCFAFPRPNGAWTVRRHGMDTKEHSSWTTDAAGWTRVEYNVDPDFTTVVKMFGAIESSKGAWVFESSVDAVRALNMVGARMKQLPVWAQDRRTTCVPKKKEPHRIIMHVAREERDENLEGFLITTRGKQWEAVVDIKAPPPNEIEADDELVRHVVASGKDSGLFLRSRQRWVQEPRQNVLSALCATGYKRSEAEHLIGLAINNFWELVNVPFAPTYPGNRQWNRDSAQLAFEPKPGQHATWDSVLHHVGRELGPAVREHPWCKTNGISTGADWLLCWVASVFQYPHEPLPYLFLYSTEEDTGKSTFHEALALLFADGKGCVRADKALTTAYNGELAGAVLCVIEELDLKNAKGARDLIKDFVTSPKVSVHAKFTTPYMINNTTHWIQCSNNAEYCPVFPGDTRITAIYVQPLEEQVSKAALFEGLAAEASAFLNTILNFEIPDRYDRLRIPCITTGGKEMTQELNRTLLEEYLDEKCFRVNGQAIKFTEFYEKFVEWLPSDQRVYWSKIKVGRQLPHWAPRGRWGSGGHRYIGNLTFRKDAVAKTPLVRVGNKLQDGTA